MNNETANELIRESRLDGKSGYVALVVLCGEENVQPVLNTGSLYG